VGTGTFFTEGCMLLAHGGVNCIVGADRIVAQKGPTGMVTGGNSTKTMEVRQVLSKTAEKPV
jgi:hypothetical protein